MYRDLEIQVTAQDIKEGIPLSATRCPIARALRRVTGKIWAVHPSFNGLRAHALVLYGDGPQPYDLPKTAARFITRFDKSLNPPPFKFNLRNVLFL